MTGYNFTDRVRKVLQLAREQALHLHHDYAGTEHLLLGLLREGGGVAAAMLADLQVDLEQLQRRVEGAAQGGRPVDLSRDLPYTSRAKKVLELAMTEARALGRVYVGTEHLLLGLLHPESTPAVTALEGAGVSLDDARAVARRLRPPSAAGSGFIVTWRQPSLHMVFLLALVALLVAIAALGVALWAGFR